MADAKIHGDERAPPIVRSLAAAPAPLTDHAAYAKQEKEADRRWKQAYAQAVDDQLPEMERLLARGQREGVPPEAIEKMQRKLQALRDARLTREDIKGVVMVGGSTRMPQVQQAVADLLGCAPLNNLNPDEVVALGAAIQANQLASMVDALPSGRILSALAWQADKAEEKLAGGDTF